MLLQPPRARDLTSILIPERLVISTEQEGENAGKLTFSCLCNSTHCPLWGDAKSFVGPQEHQLPPGKVPGGAQVWQNGVRERKTCSMTPEGRRGRSWPLGSDSNGVARLKKNRGAGRWRWR